MTDLSATFYIGIVFIIGAAFLIGLNRSVSMGQLAIAAIGALILLSPSLRNFEVSTEGFKFTTHEQGLEIVGSVEKTNDRIEIIESRLAKITQALDDYSSRVAAMEATTRTADGSTEMPPPGETTALKELKDLNIIAREATGDLYRDLGRLQGSFQTAPAMQTLPGLPLPPAATRETDVPG